MPFDPPRTVETDCRTGEIVIIKPLKWGVVSTARIGLEKVLPAMARSPDCEIVAIASRDRARAESAARKLAIPKAYGAYEDLFADAEVEAAALESALRIADGAPLVNRWHKKFARRLLDPTAGPTEVVLLLRVETVRINTIWKNIDL